jgi:diguanylate cyclase (GGDEF)-like protein/PAS domain S-box-containing protein
MNDLATTDPPHAATPAEVLQGALIDSRQRWRELVNLAADFAFETDEWGRFALVTPDPALGWSAGALIGRPASTLLTEGSDAMFDPFRVSARIHHRQAWLKRGDGGVACLTFCAAPIKDPTGRIAGARGVGIDMTEHDKQAAGVAVALRRAEVLDHILWCMGQEILIPRMMGAVLGAIANAMGAEGAAVVLGSDERDAASLAHVTGAGADQVLDAAGKALRLIGPRPMPVMAPDGRQVLVAGCQTRFGQRAGLVSWRAPGARGWDDDDSQLMGSAVNIIRMVLEHEATQREMNRQARTDPLTGLLNRRAFLEEMERHAARQDRDNQPATLMFADLDNFKPVNDRLGHEAGDEVLRRTAILLRKTFRPTDLIARLGGDEFAIWLNGADHMTAAERAEFLRDEVPRDLADITGPDGPRVSLSIGIASREAGEGEPLDSLMRRADAAMYEVKRGGRGHWRVSLRRRPSDGVR